MSIQASNTRKLCLCASERVKLISTLDGRFPDFGHHLENEMGGLWLHPIKLLDGFWMRFTDHADSADCWLSADGYTAFPYGNAFQYRGALGHTPVRIELRQLAPEEAAGVLLEYELNNTGEAREVTLCFLARADLRPTWNGEASGMIDGGRDDIRYLPELNAFHAMDCDNEWHVMFGFDRAPDQIETGELFGPDVTAGLGVSGQATLRLRLKKNERFTLRVAIAGSMTGFDDCAAQYARLRSGEDFLSAKKARLNAAAANSRLTLPDKRFETVFEWVKHNCDWLIQSTPTGRGIAAGIPEYAWWFGCDTCYTVQGLLCVGQFELCRDTLMLLLEASERACGDGRVVHEVTTDGSVYHPGNTQETAQFFWAVWDYYRWTGDRRFVERAMPYLDKGVCWLLAQDDDGDLFPSGYGIIEIAGLNLELIDSAVYTARAYEIYAELCRLFSRDEDARRFKALSAELIHRINTLLWDDNEGLYCDAFASGEALSPVLNQILNSLSQGAKAQFSASELLKSKPYKEESGWLLNRNWVINTPMETRIARRGQAERALARMHTEEFIGPYGMYLDAQNRSLTMTISTGVMAAAQVRYGHADRALALLDKMFSTFGMATPGAISEMSPDFGCFVQAWTAYAAFVPVVGGFFGIEPDVPGGIIRVSPCMPGAWNEASLENVVFPGGRLSLEFRREGGSEHFCIDNQTDMDVLFGPDSARLPRGVHEFCIDKAGR